MDTMDKTQRFSRTIPCANCGEMYSVTYKRCPFCGGPSPKRSERTSVAEAAGYERTVGQIETEEPSQPPVPSEKGGKRLKKGGGNGTLGRVILFLLSLVMIVAATYIVITKVVPIVQSHFGKDESNSQAVNGDQDQQAKSNEEDQKIEFRLLQTKATLTTKGETKQLEAVTESEDVQSDITWSSSNPEVVTVDGDGKLTAIAPGDAIITATKEDGLKAECNVQCIWDENAKNANLSLNRIDFTLEKGKSFTMQVIGTEEIPVWTSNDPKVATISEAGVVKHVAKGQTTVTATIGDQMLTCIVRCS